MDRLVNMARFRKAPKEEEKQRYMNRQKHLKTPRIVQQ